MDTDGIGIHHKITAGITTSQRKQSEFLLDKAKDQPSITPTTAPISEIIRPSNRNIRVISLSLAPNCAMSLHLPSYL